MKRKGPPPFCCGASRDMYRVYYTSKRQFGSGNMPVFVGAKYQRGNRRGNIFSGLFCSILLSFIKGNAPSWAGKTVKTGLNLVHDASRGVLFKQSIKKHVPKALKVVVEDTKFQSGSGAPKSKHRRVARPRHRGGGGGGRGRRRQHFNDILHNHHGIHQRSVMRVPQVRIRSILSN